MSFGLSAGLALGALAIGYLLGSIPFGLILTRLTGGPDLRSIGSGNIGATNVLRTGSKKLAAATLLGDMLKGTVAVLLAYHLIGGREAALVAGIGAFLGHVFPLWLGFRGGKGVATYIGILLGLSPLFALIFAAIWILVAFLTKYSSLSALVASVATPLILLVWLGDRPMAAVLGLLTALLWFMHRTNIARLLNGSEGRIGQKG